MNLWKRFTCTVRRLFTATPTTNKLGVQCQEAGQGIYAYNAIVQPNSIKAINVVDPEFWRRIWAENPRLEFAIYRECPNGPDPFTNPEATAAAWVKHLKGKIGHLVDAGLVTHIEGYNEWIHSFQTAQFPAAGRFMAALIDETHKQFEGKVHIIILNASCGHFSDVPNADGVNITGAFPSPLTKLNQCPKCMLGLHSYDRGNMDRLHLEGVAKGDGGYWLCGRFLRVEQALKDAGYGNISIALTEIGLDDAVDRPLGSHHWGWKHYGATVEEAVAHFLNEHNLGWYYPLLSQSKMVKLASIFGCSMYEEGNWGEWGFDIDHGFPMLLDGIKNLEGVEPSPPEPPNGGEEVDDIKVVDLDYNERDYEYIKQKYGVTFRRANVKAGYQVYRLIEMWEKAGPATLVTQVLDEDGNPVPGADVTFYWPDAPDPPDPPTPVYAHDWFPNFTHGLTNVNGDVGPGMGTGAYHGRGEGGPHKVWVHDPNIKSDICEKLGMLAGTHHEHVDLKFKRITVEEEPEPPPTPPEPPSDVGEELVGMGERLIQIGHSYGASPPSTVTLEFEDGRQRKYTLSLVARILAKIRGR